MTDRDQLRDRIANKVAAWVTLTYAVETYSEDTLALADAVLDALQLEQVGWLAGDRLLRLGGGPVPGEMVPVVPVYIVREAEG